MSNNDNYFNEKIPKVLIVDHPPISKEGIGKTLYAFFAKWPKEKLRQIYSVNLPLDTSLCEYYFYDQCGKGRDTIYADRTGFNYDKKEYLFEQWGLIKELLKNFAHGKLGTICRNRYFEKKIKVHNELMKWVKSFSPECIFLGVGEIISENYYILKIASSLHIPLILYISDDYLGKWENEWFLKKYAQNIKRNYDALMKYSSLVVVISEKMKEVYQERYSDQHYFVAQNSAYIKKELPLKNYSINGKRIFTVSYTGNIGLKRWKILKKIKDIITIINQTCENYMIYIEIYTPTPINKWIECQITNRYSNYKGSIVGEKLDRVRYGSDVLLFVESFEKNLKPILSTALSTKIPEYLSYHRNILTIAPEYSWSARYLEENGASSSILGIDDLEEKLRSYFDDLYYGRLKEQIPLGNKLFLENHEFYRNADDFLKEVLQIRNFKY